MSLSYIHAVAARAGFELMEPRIDIDSVDGLLKSTTGRRPQIDFQAKATSQPLLHAQTLIFPLPIKNYNDLRAETINPRILIVVALPMDEAEAKVLIDFGGRNWIVWNATFKREKIGEMPTEMFFHFFKSFSDAAKCNLNIECHGDNEHHKIEAIFKAFAKAIRMAVKRDPLSNYLPSTKGVL